MWVRSDRIRIAPVEDVRRDLAEEGGDAAVVPGCAAAPAVETHMPASGREQGHEGRVLMPRELRVDLTGKPGVVEGVDDEDVDSAFLDGVP